MDRLQAMEVFARVVEANSFSRASDSLDLSRTSVTTIVKSLEAHLRTPLLQRTTRKLKLTPEGAEYYEHCVRILAEISETEAAMAGAGRGPRGKLRVDMPATIGKWVVTPHLYRFHELYPDVELIVGYGDKLVDLIQDGVDCVIRMGMLEESSLVAKRIGNARIVTCASPAYLERHGIPKTLEELAGHRAVNYVSARTGRTFPFEYNVGDEVVKVQMKSVLAVNDGSVYINAGALGHGIIQPSRFMVSELIRQGALREILEDFESPSTPLSVVYPHRRNLSSRLRAFVDWVSEIAHKNPDLRINE